MAIGPEHDWPATRRRALRTNVHIQEDHPMTIQTPSHERSPRLHSRTPHSLLNTGPQRDTHSLTMPRTSHIK